MAVAHSYHYELLMKHILALKNKSNHVVHYNNIIWFNIEYEYCWSSGEQGNFVCMHGCHAYMTVYVRSGNWLICSAIQLQWYFTTGCVYGGRGGGGGGGCSIRPVFVQMFFLQMFIVHRFVNQHNSYLSYLEQPQNLQNSSMQFQHEKPYYANLEDYSAIPTFSLIARLRRSRVTSL